ncbi:hypothetical protein G9P44_000556 [Scheffersomyces stipitis]|nr:hypothetical protein G9P44_000556 [Scheffersomyces stipitis]
MREMTEARQKQISQFNKQLWQAGLTGMLEGTLVALVSGYYFKYKFNHGHNARFFKAPYQMWWLVSWNFVGIIFTTDLAKIKISKQVAIEDEIKRNRYLEEEFYGSPKKVDGGK